MLNTYRTYEENELLSLMAQDDKAAFTELYDRFWKKLFVIAFNRIKDKQSAEDIVHDVFASLWNNRTQVNIDQLENYLAVAVRYSVFSTIKKKSRAKQIEQNVSLSSIVEMPVETSLHYKKILELVKTEVEHLPEKCRIIFKYSRDAGMPVKEIARQLHLSPKTVENQLGKAIRQLKLATRSLLQSFFTLMW
ncbi:MAG: RNA polymerase sigma-70 factor [Chitinophagaceae bacterium]|jgi:RNA polymerase sigma-70 factor (ECF subfamily)|nr:RNA polymerase sigma-70 factor [Chitinophagaceae bacterium]